MEALREQGWWISPNGYNVISQNDTVRNKNILTTNALNTDIKEFGEAILSQELKQSQIGKVVLQIQKIRNISAPKANENSQAAPRMLKLTLTDGHTNCQAVEIASIRVLSSSTTAPGSKILINSAKVSANCILLHPNCCTLLGGKVPALYEKWELSKNVLEQRTGGIDGPPPWVNFGEKIVNSLSDESFKALAIKESKKDEFDIQRQDAINVVATGAVKKVFGGGSKNVALTEAKKSYNREKHYKKRETEKVEEQQKAPDKISLFNFLEEKLQTNDDNNMDFHKSQKDYNGKYQKFRDYKPKVVQKKINSSGNDSLNKNFENLSINNQNENIWNWKVGDLCMAKYWEDGKYYNARVVNLTERTCVVQFSGYGNVEEVLKVDCIPIHYEQKQRQYKTRNYRGSSNYQNRK